MLTHPIIPLLFTCIVVLSSPTHTKFFEPSRASEGEKEKNKESFSSPKNEETARGERENVPHFLRKASWGDGVGERLPDMSLPSAHIQWNHGN